jgi:hypothetical protein
LQSIISAKERVVNLQALVANAKKLELQQAMLICNKAKTIAS